MLSAAVLLTLTAHVQAEGPTVADLLTSLQQHHPKMLELEAKGMQQRYALEAASAAFDVQFEQQSAVRSSGYYDGSMASQRLIKPLPYGNTKLKAEYRLAGGNFPVYEAQYDTLSGGEASIGLTTSLLRNRDTDKKRMAISDAEIAIQEWQASSEQKQSQLFYDGLHTYLEWYKVHLVLQIYESLLDTTLTRRDAIAKRVEAGDMAAITLTEFDATVMSRRLALQSVYQKAEQARAKLAYYFRTDLFEPVPVSELTVAPQDIAWPWLLVPSDIQQFKQQLFSHPVLRQVRMDRKLADNKVSLAKNELLPELTLEAKLAQDFGAGPASLEQTESKVGLQFSMPIGRRQARAELASAQLKGKEIDYQIKQIEDALTRDFDVALVDWRYSQTLADMQEKQASLAEVLFEQEKKRFAIGDSNLFVLNTREASAINSRLSAVKARINVMRSTLNVAFAAGVMVLRK